MAEIDLTEFPRELAYGSSGGPSFNTSVTALSSGFEGRQQNWENARIQYDAAPAIHNTERLSELLKFFYARKGRARGFLFFDYMDNTSADDNQSDPSDTDQVIGVGDGVEQNFQLSKTYTDGVSEYVRPISRVVSGSVVVSLNDVPQASGWSVSSLGEITFDTAPAIGVVVKAGFEFYIPMRFDTDFLDTSIDAYKAYQTASVPLIEIREVE